jgi:hypothetical protein
MNGRKAKAIRRLVYDGRDFRERTYTQTTNGFRIIRIDTTKSLKVPMRTIYADAFRAGYQRMKKA